MTDVPTIDRLSPEEAALASEWLCVGHVAMLGRPGDYYTADVAGELIVIVRGDDRIRILSRVCLHRWAPVVEGAGNARRFSCPFHMWSYGLDGQLLAAPHMERAADFHRRNCRLPEFRCHIDHGLIFLSLVDLGDLPDGGLELELPDPRAVMVADVALIEDVPLRVSPESSNDNGILVRNLNISRSGDTHRIELLLPNGRNAATAMHITLKPKS